MRSLRITEGLLLFIVGLGLLFASAWVGSPGWAQTAAAAPPVTMPPGWEQVAAALINMLLSLLLAKLGAWGIPLLRERYPAMLPVLTAVLGALIAAMQSWLQQAGGPMIGLSPAAGLFTGASSVAVAQFFIQRRRMKAVPSVTKLSSEGAPL